VFICFTRLHAPSSTDTFLTAVAVHVQTLKPPCQIQLVGEVALRLNGCYMDSTPYMQCTQRASAGVSALCVNKYTAAPTTL
jgi:hypothetical protein